MDQFSRILKELCILIPFKDNKAGGKSNKFTVSFSSIQDYKPVTGKKLNTVEKPVTRENMNDEKPVTGENKPVTGENKPVTGENKHVTPELHIKKPKEIIKKELKKEPSITSFNDLLKMVKKTNH